MNGNYSSSPTKESTTGRPDRDPRLTDGKGEEPFPDDANPDTPRRGHCGQHVTGEMVGFAIGAEASAHGGASFTFIPLASGEPSKCDTESSDK